MGDPLPGEMEQRDDIVAREQHAIERSRRGAARVAQQGEVDAPELFHPLAVAVEPVDAHAHYRRAARLELLQPALEAEDLRGTDEGEVGRVEEQDHPAPAQPGQREAASLASQHALEREVRQLGLESQHARC